MEHYFWFHIRWQFDLVHLTSQCILLVGLWEGAFFLQEFRLFYKFLCFFVRCDEVKPRDQVLTVEGISSLLVYHQANGPHFDWSSQYLAI